MKEYAIAFLATILILLVVWKIGDSAEEPENTYYSNFFRYTEDGSIVYLGRVKGDVTDLSVSTLEFEH